MKVTTYRDVDAGTVQVIMDMRAGADPSAMGRLAADSVSRVLLDCQDVAVPCEIRVPIAE